MVDKRAFDPQKALDPFDKKFNWDARLGGSKHLCRLYLVLGSSEYWSAKQI
jgi:hypothetical protein